MSESIIIVKVAPLGERVREVSVAPGTKISDILGIAEVDLNGRSIIVNNAPAELDTPVTADNAVISLVTKAKAGKK